MQKFLNEKELAKAAGLSVQTLRNYRSEKKLFPYVKMGRSVRYPVDEVEKILNSKIVKADS